MGLIWSYVLAKALRLYLSFGEEEQNTNVFFFQNNKSYEKVTDHPIKHLSRPGPPRPINNEF